MSGVRVAHNTISSVVRDFLIADGAFDSKTWLIKPFFRRGLANNERIFNYRQSKTRHVVENSRLESLQTFRYLDLAVSSFNSCKITLN